MVRVALDACILYAFPVADTLLRLAEPAIGLCEVTWSVESLEEMERVFIRRGRSQEQGERRAAAMTLAFPEATIARAGGAAAKGWRDPRDQHVVEAAVAARASILVTDNLRDFDSDALSAHGLLLQNPDDFLSDLLEVDADLVIAVLEQQAQAIERDVEALLRNLGIANRCLRFVTRATSHLRGAG